MAKPKTPENEPELAAWLTRVAFVLSLGLVIARATMMEVLRDPMNITAGASAVPRGPGPGTSLVFDLLAWTPALLVLGRAMIDRAFSVRFTWAHALLAALAVWAMLSTLWSADRFAAAVSAFHFVSAAVFLWSASQLVRSWQRLRLVGGVCAGLLLVYGAQALSSRYIDQPQLSKDWIEHRDQRLIERGIDPNSFAAKQFEDKLLRGEMMGFDASPNSFAAVTVLLIVVTLGVIVQRVVDRDGVGWIVVPAIGIAVGGAIIVWVDSKTAYATPVLALGILAATALAGSWLTRHARLAYTGGVACVVLALAAVVGHGLYHGTLPSDSLAFRWRYWIGAWRIFTAHPLLGVGWENFGQHYLAARLPIAAEEIRDPHNFLVRFATELGIVGGALCVLWMLRMWWEMIRPATAIQPHDGPPRRALSALIIIAAAACVLSIFATVDFGFMSLDPQTGPAYVTLRLIERVFGSAILLAGMLCACVRSMNDATLDERPAPWLLRAMLAALAVFLLHNLVDFSMFEIGPMFLFAMMVGSVIGIRTDVARPNPRRMRVTFAASAVVWLIAAGGLVLPVVIAEDRAASGDEQLRTKDPTRAAQSYRDAMSIVPYNGEYALSAARAGGTVDAVRDAFWRALYANPMQASYHASLAQFEAELPTPDKARVKSEYDAALALDPANVPMRLKYAEYLEKLGFASDAKAQLERALWFDDQLAPDEVERLSPGKVAEIREKIATVDQSKAKPTTSRS